MLFVRGLNKGGYLVRLFMLVRSSLQPNIAVLEMKPPTEPESSQAEKPTHESSGSVMSTVRNQSL